VDNSKIILKISDFGISFELSEALPYDELCKIAKLKDTE